MNSVLFCTYSINYVYSTLIFILFKPNPDLFYSFSTSILTYFILFSYSILFYFILFYPVYSTQFLSWPLSFFSPIISWSILFYSILFYFIHSILFILFNPILTFFILFSYSVLFYFTLSYPVYSIQSYPYHISF